MNQMPIFVNLKGRKVILLGEGTAMDAKRRLYERAGAEISDDEQADASLAVVALDDPDAAKAAAGRLRARGLLVNVVDRPDLCDFTTPAIVDRDPVLIAIGTGGASAGLAKALRQRLEQLLPASLASLAAGLAEVRSDMKALWPDSADRRRAIDRALDPGGALDPLTDGAADNIGQWLNDPAGASIQETVEITLGSRNPDDLTIGQARLLGQADRIYAAKNVPDDIMDRARADAERFDIAAHDGEQAGLVLLIRMKD